MIRIVSGDIFHPSSPKAIGHGVNLDGVMGAGIALTIRKKFPQCFNAYHQSCVKGRLKLGECLGWSDKEFIIFNIATQKSWRTLAEPEAIRTGIASMLEQGGDLALSEIALPRIGAGLGGLGWTRVLSIIENAYERVSESKPDLVVFQNYIEGQPAENMYEE